MKFFVLLWLFTASLVYAEKIVLVAGGGDGTNDVPAAEAGLRGPFGVDFDRNGNMFIVEMTAGRVLKIDPKGILTLIAGSGEKGFAGDAGPARRAEFNGIHNLAVTPNGDIYLADTWNYRVRKIDGKTGLVSTVAGTGDKGFGGDGGLATAAKFSGIHCVSLDPSGRNMVLADLDNRRVRAVDLKTGMVRLVAGNGTKGIPGDGSDAVSAPLVDPRAAIADGKGNVYILERSGNALRLVDREGKIRTVAGNGEKGNTGDQGPAREATMNGPKHLCFDLEGNVLIADTENHVIRKYRPRTGDIVRIAGSGKKGSAGLGGPPLEVELSQPHGVYVHPSGILYISDSSNNRVLKIVP